MKKIFKFFTSLLLIMTMCIGISINSYAADNDISNNAEFSSSKKLEGHATLNSNDVQVSDVMSYQEMIAEIAKDNGWSIETANEMYALSNNQDTLERAIAAPYANTYRTITISLPVKPVYKPQLKVYCQTSEGGTMWGIVKINNVNMNRIYQNVTRQFSGSVYVNLEDASTIYWTVDGDFFNNGSTTVSAGGNVNIPVGTGVQISFQVSYANDLFATYWDEGRWSI